VASDSGFRAALGIDDGWTPNPFLVDDPDYPLSDPRLLSPMPVPPLHPVTLPLEVLPAEMVLLTAAQTELPLPPDSELSPPPIVNNALPTSLVTELETGDKPAVHFPQLVMPTMFLPIPNVCLHSYSIWWLTSAHSPHPTCY